MTHTWERDAGTGIWFTLEQIDGTPDRQVWKEGGSWWCKWRTSAKTSGPFVTRKAAQDDR